MTVDKKGNLFLSLSHLFPTFQTVLDTVEQMDCQVIEEEKCESKYETTYEKKCETVYDNKVVSLKMVNVTVETNEFVDSVKQFMTPFKTKNAS